MYGPVRCASCNKHFLTLAEEGRLLTCSRCEFPFRVSKAASIQVAMIWAFGGPMAVLIAIMLLVAARSSDSKVPHEEIVAEASNEVSVAVPAPASANDLVEVIGLGITRDQIVSVFSGAENGAFVFEDSSGQGDSLVGNGTRCNALMTLSGPATDLKSAMILVGSGTDEENSATLECTLRYIKELVPDHEQCLEWMVDEVQTAEMGNGSSTFRNVRVKFTWNKEMGMQSVTVSPILTGPVDRSDAVAALRSLVTWTVDDEGMVTEVNVFSRESFVRAAPLLAGLPRLKHLSAMDADITDSDLQLLPGLPALQSLTLRGNPINGEGLTCLTRTPNLNYLNLISTNATDAALVHLKKLPKLSSVFLDRTCVSDAGLVHLSHMDRGGLHRIHISHTQVTPNGVAYLRRTLPGMPVFAAHLQD